MIRVLAAIGAGMAEAKNWPSFARLDSRGRLSPHELSHDLSRGLSAKTVGLVAICLILAMAGCYSGSRPARIGTAAPDFTVRDSDRSVTLSQFKGQVVVLNFWATWCPPCIEEMPSLVQMQERMKARGVTVLAVSVDVDQSNYRRFLRDHNVDLLSVRDADQKSNALYGTFKFPETYVIDRNGIMRRKFIGAVDWTEPDVIEYLGKL
jgi:cytochrome c biogenesis protein CcmG, thiol:disulfide interchange protein DsbE